MKKLLIFCFALAFCVSCQKEAVEQYDKENGISRVSMTLTAAVTKTILADDGVSINWQAGDVISVFDENANNEKFTTTDEGASATFSGSVLSTSTEFFAMSPYRTTNTQFDYEKRTLRTYLLTGQTAKLGSFPEDRNISVATVNTDENTIAFSNVCGLLKFRLTREDVKQVSFTAKAGENIGRYVDIEFSQEGDIASIATVQDDKGATITLTPDNEVFVPGTYYAVVLPNTLSQGLAIDLELTDGSTLTIDNTAVLKIQRNKKINLGTIDEGFAALPASRNVSAGSTVNFATAKYESSQLWSGEMYHDYAYSVEGRVVYPDYYMSFGTVNQISTADVDTNPIYVKYSTDFDGTYEYTGHVGSATWSDISEYFDFDDSFKTTSADYKLDESYTNSGDFEMTECFENGTKTYIAFCYDIEPAQKTIVYLKNFKVERELNGEREVVYEMKATEAQSNGEGSNLIYVNGSNTSIADYSKFYKSSTELGYYDVLKFSCRGAKATGRQHGYAIAEITRESVSDPVCDTPAVNSASEAIDWTYTAPGTYPVVVVSVNGTKTYVCKTTLIVE